MILPLDDVIVVHATPLTETRKVDVSYVGLSNVDLILHVPTANGFSSHQYLYLDFVLVVTLVFSVANSANERELGRMTSVQTLLGFQPIFSLVAFITIQVMTFVIGLLYLRVQSWFLPAVDEGGNEQNGSYENAVVFQLTSLSVIYSVIVFNKTIPQRKPHCYNALILILLWLIPVLYIVYPVDVVNIFFEMKPLPYLGFRLNILLISAADLLVCLIIEKVILGVWCNHRQQSRLDDGANYRKEVPDDDEVWPPFDNVPIKRNSAFVSHTAQGVLVVLTLGH
ncbi:hypothetical protein LSH36_1155g00003 [Paralvinella palmiformis]|uniref:Uncharacterized protein n=1 Tax=Paralvinella palmiformis TaxID=53620 RepID=A0AAD9IUD2_9ANNE|nr:hypothetical protein LSH36_1155g00003 [Paralvinella palmiformis]